MADKQRPFFKSLRGKLTMQTLAVGLIPVVLVGALAYQTLAQLTDAVDERLSTSREQLAEDVVGANLSSTSAQIAAQIDLFLRERIADALVWSTAPVIVDSARDAREKHRLAGLDDLTIDQVEARFTDEKSLGEFERANDYLKQQISLSPHFREVFFTDTKGFNVGLTNPTSDFVQNDEGWWQQAWQSGISIGDVEFDDSAGIWSIEISVRIVDPRNNDSLGVMKTVLGISLIQGVTDDAAKAITKGKVSVLNTGGLLIADTESEHARRKIMNEAVNLKSGGGAVATAAYGNQPAGYTLAGDSVVGFAKSAGGDYYKELAENFTGFGWVTLVEQPRAVAFAPIAGLGIVQRELEDSRNTLAIVLLAAILVVAVLSVVMATLLSRGITVPVLQLRDVAERVSRGDTSQEVTAASDDEVGDLARDFERMRKSVEVAMRRMRGG
ncbi:MAG: HAMP domain-containing protein [Pseudomonadota bacterium]